MFVIGMLKKIGRETALRQEVGRGLRLAVNQNGDRMDDPAIVHEINVLTVVAANGYKETVAQLEKEYVGALSGRPQTADAICFTGKVLKTAAGDISVTPQMASSIAAYLFNNDYVDKDDRITPAYHEAKQAGTIVALHARLAAHASEIVQHIDLVYSKDRLPEIVNGRKGQSNPLNDNCKKKAFRELWSRIHNKAIYSVQFDTVELIEKCVPTLDTGLKVAPLQYVVQRGEQAADTTYIDVSGSESDFSILSKPLN